MEFLTLREALSMMAILPELYNVPSYVYVTRMLEFALVTDMNASVTGVCDKIDKSLIEYLTRALPAYKVT